MKKTILTIVLLVSFFISDTAFACKPGPNLPTTQNEMAAQKDAVFIGTVQSIYQDRSANADYKVLFKVNQAYKGLNGSNTVTVTIASSSAACGYDAGYETFKPGTVWIINANGSIAEGFTTNSLSLNSSYNSYGVAQAAMLKLQAESAPKDDTPTMCTMQYAPVCGKKDTGIRCIKAPCPSFETKTYGNSCMLGADKAEFLYEGECKGESVSVTPKPTVNVDATIGADIDASGDTEMPIDITSTPRVSFWQKIMISIKSIFSFWK